ncbi:MAG: hypothetical protein IJD60_06250 [Clostridia bacterium]|nr:hypothetical protein [Clostridia bacterium]
MLRALAFLLAMLTVAAPVSAQADDPCAYARKKPWGYACQETAKKPAGDAFFEDALMIGDSICASLNNYDVLPELWIETVIGQSAHAVHQLRNLPYGGKKISMLDLIRDEQPEKLLIMIGSNGVDYKKAEDAIVGYHEMLDKVLEAAPDTKIYLLTVTPVRSHAQKKYPRLVPENIAAFNQALYALAESHGVHYIDVTTPLLDEEGVWIDRAYAAGDGIHISKEGAERAAEAIRMQVSR